MSDQRTRKRTTKGLPFSIARGSGRSLVEQTVAGIREAILSGYYKTGDFLPPFEEIAAQLGTSVRIPTEAVRRLVVERFVRPRPRVGCEVLSRGGRSWVGHILIVIPTSRQAEGYSATLVGEVRRRLSLSGYLVETVAYDLVRGRPNFALFDHKLAHLVDFVFAMYTSQCVVNRIEKSKIPYIGFLPHGVCGRTNLAPVSFSFDGSLGRFVDMCRARRFRRVLVIEYEDSFRGLAEDLKARGLRVETIDIQKGMADACQHEKLCQLVQDAMIGRFADRRRACPDVIFFTDDRVAAAALSVLSYLGIRTPEDFRAVTFSNAGIGPVYPRSLAMIRNDPHSNAQQIADAIVRALSGAVSPRPIVICPSFVPGDSFR